MSRFALRCAGATCMALCAWALGGCEERPASEQRGRELIAAHGCGACHEVAGVRGARGMAGPPLTAFGRRVLIAGHLPNTQPNLQRWIMDPQRVEPGTAMPDLDVSADEADAMAAYLLSLQ